MVKIQDMEYNKVTRMDVFLSGYEEKKDRTGKEYCTLRITDGKTKVNGNIWKTSGKMVEPYVGKVVTVSLIKRIYNGGDTFTVQTLEECATEHPLSDFIICVPGDLGNMFDFIVNSVMSASKKKSGTDSLGALVSSIYNENKADLLRWSAAKYYHHACYGGLLYHTYRMMKSAVALSSIYEGVDKELLFAGVALHDIGKLKELDTNVMGDADFTVEGSLLGHAMIGIEMISHYAQNMKIPEEKIFLLKHLVASHHGKLEYGAITSPAIPEAMLLNHIDDMDAKIYVYNEELEKTEPGKLSGNKSVPLDNVHVYRKITE